jgi:formiminoglutamase
MSWKMRYVPPNVTLWQGRRDAPAASCYFQVVKTINLTQHIPVIEKFSFGLIGFSCDEGIRRNLGRIGAKEGPFEIRAALAKMPFPPVNIDCYDAGTITCEDGNLEGAQHALSEAVALLLDNNITPIVLGGGHELAWGHYQGIAKVYSHNNLGIINFDAHFDMRPLLTNRLGSSGTPFLQIATAHDEANRRFDYNCIGIQPAGNTQALFDTANTHQAHFVYAESLYQQNTNDAETLINRVITDNDMLYVSLCLDVFAAAYAPGVSAPQTLGLTPWQVIPYVRELAASGKVISYDLAELSPKYDIDNRTAKLAANLIFEIMLHHNIEQLGKKHVVT